MTRRSGGHALAGLGLPGVLPALFVLAASVGVVFPNATALAMNDHPDKAGNASALLGTAQFLIGGVAAPLASTAVSMGMVMTAVAVAAVLAFALLTRASTRKPAIDRPAVAG